MNLFSAITPLSIFALAINLTSKPHRQTHCCISASFMPRGLYNSSMPVKLSTLANRNLLLGVSGSIAAYKACELLRLYQKQGAHTRVIMTKQAAEFVTPLTMQALSGNEVHSELVDYKSESGMGHIQLARWADCLVIAPASASCLARLANGEASDLLSAVFLATSAPRVIAPAMNKEMWNKQATQNNLSKLAKAKDTFIVQPDNGWQACGEVGEGRLAEPLHIAEKTASLFSSNALAGLEVLITAGPTREPLDQARFISNYSSGKMGYALARAAEEAGAKVTLVSGPTEIGVPANCTLIKVIKVETAQQMLDACLSKAAASQVFIAAAAVADWRPSTQAKGKMPKQDVGNTLALTQNPDILMEVSKALPKGAIKLGFAAEAADLKSKASAKLKRKGLDMICANLISEAFAKDDNKILLLFANKPAKQLKQMSKLAAAQQIIKQIAQLLND